MNTFLVIAFTWSGVCADIGLKLRQQQGYNYPAPQTSYGVPSYQVSSNTGYSASSGNGYGFAQGSNKQPSAEYSSGFQTLADIGNAAGSQYYQSGAVNSGLQSGFVQPSYQFGGASQDTYQTYNQYQSSNLHKYQEHYNQQPPQIFKHFYVHAAPEEPEVPRPRQPINLPAPEKHYKIIFIKTPTQTSPPQYVPVPPQNEEKTIVYVLVKNPEEQKIVIPKVEPKPPSKPEVFFIKYNNKEDSQAVINNIVTDYNNKGDSVSFGGLTSGDAAVSGGYAHTGNLGQTAQFGTGTEYGQAVVGSSKFGAGSAATGQVVGVTNNGFKLAGLGNESSSSAGFTSGSFGAASSFNNDGVNNNYIATSQGVPHETYGTPKFRA